MKRDSFMKYNKLIKKLFLPNEKRINKNIFSFVVIFVIIICGFISGTVFEDFSKIGEEYNKNLKKKDVFEALSVLTENVEKSIINSLFYHNDLVDINSFYKRVVNTKIIEKEDMTVIKSNSGYLSNTHEYIDDETFEKRAESLKELYDVSKENGAEFLYVIAPVKGYSMEYPKNVIDYTKDNCDRFSRTLDSFSIPYLSLINSMINENITEEEMFFVTDHHWKPQWGMWATEKICDELNARYGFTYDKSTTDINNYNIQTFKDWFLGSQGKKAGKYFTALGADDFDIITPEFETNFVEYRPHYWITRKGEFASTVLYMEYMRKKDYYGGNPYRTYSGGDFRQQEIINFNNLKAPTAVIVRDSFACTVVPFFSLNTSTLYIADERDFAYIAGGKFNLNEYIEAIKPDYVIVMYSGTPATEDMYEF